VGEERVVLLPALRDLMLCRRLECSWAALQEMPEEYLEVWQAVLAGEDQAHAQRAARA